MVFIKVKKKNYFSSKSYQTTSMTLTTTTEFVPFRIFSANFNEKWKTHTKEKVKKKKEKHFSFYSLPCIYKCAITNHKITKNYIYELYFRSSKRASKQILRVEKKKATMKYHTIHIRDPLSAFDRLFWFDQFSQRTRWISLSVITTHA